MTVLLTFDYHDHPGYNFDHLSDYSAILYILVTILTLLITILAILVIILTILVTVLIPLVTSC